MVKPHQIRKKEVCVLSEKKEVCVLSEKKDVRVFE